MTQPAQTAPEASAATPAPAAPAPDAASTTPGGAPPPPEVQPETAPADAAGSAAETPPGEPPKPAEPARDPLAEAQKTLERAKAGARRNLQQRTMQQRYEAQLAEERAARQQAEAKAQWAERVREAAAKGDRATVLREMGLSAKQIAEEAAKEGTPEATVEALQRQIAEEKTARQQLEAKIAQERQQQHFAKVRQDFMSSARDSALYPNLAGVNPEIVLDAAMATIQRLQQNPTTRAYTYSDAEVLEFLNDTWTASDPRPAPPNGSAKATAAPSATAQANGSATSRPLTNASGAKGYTLPKNFEDLDDLAQVQEMAKMLGASGLPGVNKPDEPTG